MNPVEYVEELRSLLAVGFVHHSETVRANHYDQVSSA